MNWKIEEASDAGARVGPKTVSDAVAEEAFGTILR